MLLQIQIGGDYYINGPAPGIDWAKLIGTICSVFTLLLAWRIFKTLDVHKKFAEKQLTVVLELIAHFESIRLIGNFYEVDGKKTRGAHFIRFNKLYNTVSNVSDANRPLVIHADVVESMMFTQFQYNPFLPKSIAIEMRKMFGESGHMIIEKPRPNEILISFPNAKEYPIAIKETANDEIQKWRRMEGKPFNTYGEYINQLLVVKRSIYNWLSKYGATDINMDLYEPTKLKSIKHKKKI